MYLAKYILLALVFAASLLFVIRTCSATSAREWRGKLARALLSVLLLAFVGVIWYYATEENFGFKWVEIGARAVSAVLYVIALPDVWSDTKKAEEADPIDGAENAEEDAPTDDADKDEQ